MTDQEKIKRFEQLFTRLKKNRENVPLRDLRTKHAKAYNGLVAEPEELADWYASIPAGLPDWDYGKVAEIHKRESRPGELVRKYKMALIEALDYFAFETFALEYHATVCQEAGPKERG